MVLNTELTLLILGVILLTTVLAGTLTSRFGFPALIGFLGLGMLAGIDGPGGYYFENFALTQGIGIACLLFILFSGGMGTDWRDVRRMAAPALLLATVGVLISAAIVTLAAIFILGFGPLQGALLGAVIASTDAAAVFAVLRSTGLDLHGDVPALIETESGSNDPMAIFLVGAVLYLIASPAASPLDLAPDFVIQMAMGALVGVGVGYGMPELLKRGGFSQGGLAFVISIAAALIAFGLAELLAGNGFLASYIAGIVAGNRTYAGRETVSQFQDGMAWLSQVVMFFTLYLSGAIPQIRLAVETVRVLGGAARCRSDCSRHFPDGRRGAGRLYDLQCGVLRRAAVQYHPGPDDQMGGQAAGRAKFGRVTYSPASRATSRQPISRRQKPLSKSIWSTAA